MVLAFRLRDRVRSEMTKKLLYTLGLPLVLGIAVCVAVAVFVRMLYYIKAQDFDDDVWEDLDDD